MKQRYVRIYTYVFALHSTKQLFYTTLKIQIATQKLR